MFWHSSKFQAAHSVSLPFTRSLLSFLFLDLFIALTHHLALLVSCSGQTPAESDFQVLEIARKLEMFGVRFHPAADREGTKINLSVAHMGLQVFQVRRVLPTGWLWCVRFVMENSPS